MRRKGVFRGKSCATEMAGNTLTLSGAEKEGDNTLDRYIVDYLLRTGKLKSAKAVAARKDIEVSSVKL